MFTTVKHFGRLLQVNVNDVWMYLSPNRNPSAETFNCYREGSMLVKCGKFCSVSYS